MLSPPYNVFFDITRPSLPLSKPFPPRIFHAARTCKLALVVLSNMFFCSKWPMLELSAFFDAEVSVLPLFYELSPEDLSDKEKLEEWDKRWEEFASKDSRIEVSSWARARRRLSSINGLVFNKSVGELAYLEEIVSAIYQMVPPLFRSSLAGVHGRDRLCKVFVDKFKELEQRQQNPSTASSTVSVLGVHGLLGSGKTTLCACLCDHFFSSFAGRALHLKLPTDPTPTELLRIAKQLLKLTDFGHNREKMMSEIEDLSEMYVIFEASNLRKLKVFLVIDNISSQESIESVKAILRLGVGAGSRVILVARAHKVLCPDLLEFSANLHSHIHYVCDCMTVPNINEVEAVCLLKESVGSLSLISDASQKMEKIYSPIHQGILAKVARMCAFHDQRHKDHLLYLPLALKIIGPLLRSNGVDLDRQLSKLDAIMEDFKEVAVKKLVEESYQSLPEKLKRLFLDVALFMAPYCQPFKKENYESAVELLGFMHECRSETIKRELNDLTRLCFLERSRSGFGVHDVFLEFAKSIPDASSMYYCRRRKMARVQIMSELSMMAHTSRVGLRALILEVDEKCERFDFPLVGLSSVKVVVVRECKSLAVLGLAGLTSLVSLEVHDCPRLRHVELDPIQAYTLKSVRWAKWGAFKDARREQPQQGISSQKSLLQMVQAGSGMPAKWSMNVAAKVWCSMSALGWWHHRPPLNEFLNLASQLKALQTLRLEGTGITRLGDLSSCWPQLQVLEVLEGHLEELELGNLPNLKQFLYGNVFRSDFCCLRINTGPVTKGEPRMLRKPDLLAGCPELEDVRICAPCYEDAMGSLRLPPNSRTLWLKQIYDGEPVLLEFTSSAHLLEEICVVQHCVLQSIKFTCQFLNMVEIWLEDCPNLVTVTALEWLPMLRRLYVKNCAKLQSLGNLDSLRMLDTLYLKGCPMHTISSRALSSQHLVTFKVLGLQGCPKGHFLASDLEKLTALSYLRCNVFGNMFKLKNFEQLKYAYLSWKGAEEQANNPLSLCSYDDEAKCEQVLNGNVAQIQGMKYVPLLVVGESAAPPLFELGLCGVQNLVSLDGIHRLSATLRKLKLKDLPKLTCLQELESLTNLEKLVIRQCMAVKELPSLCSLMKVHCLWITECANLIRLEGFHNMRSLKDAHFDGCESLEHLELRPDMLEQLGHLSFRGCSKLASIQAMVGWVLDEKISKVVLRASCDALNWELTKHLLEKPRERKELAEQLVATLGVYVTKKHPALTQGCDFFDFQPWAEKLKNTVCMCATVRSSWRRLQEWMKELGRVPLKEVLQQCQSDARFRASVANCLIQTEPRFLSFWLCEIIFKYPDFRL